MPYVGRTPSAVPVTADDIPANSIDASKIVDGSIELAEIADNSITDAKLNSSKLDGIETGATNYIHPTTHATADIADNAITEAKIADAAVVSLKSGRKNLIINGGFDVWQRGTSFSGTTAQYTADRWTTWGTLDISVDKVSDGALITHPTSTESLLEYRMEDKDTAKVRGNTVTLSIEATLGTSAGFQLYLYARNSSGSWYWGGDAAQRVVVGSSGKHSTTFDIPDDVGINTLRLRISNHNTVAYQSGTVTIHTVQLELGSVATEFEHRSYGEELALCQRYFEMTGATHPDTWTGDHYYDCIYRHSIGVTNVIPGALYKVTKRVAPSVIIYNKYGGANAWHTNNVSRAVVGVEGGVDGFVRFTSASSASDNNNNFFAFTADAEL